MYNLKLWRIIYNNPDSNTGLDSQAELEAAQGVEARIDGLTIIWTYSASCLVDQHILHYLDIALDMVDSIPRKIGVLWDYSHVSPSGTLYCLRRAENGLVRCRLAISGEDASRLGNARLRGFMVWAEKNLLDLKCSRIDLAVDDYSKKLHFQQLENAISNQHHSGFKVSRTVRNHGSKFSGWTVYLGSRQSEFMVRIYDKWAETLGLLNCIRWEAEIKGDTAEALFPLLLSFPTSEEEYQNILINYAIGKIKFIDTIDKNISRCPLLVWWSEWIEFIGCVPKKIFVARKQPNLAKTKQWLQKSVAKSLAMIRAGLGTYYFPHFLEELLKSGKERMKNIDELKVADYVDYSHFYENNMDGIKIQLVDR
jgi:hypothetical protein